MTPKFAEQIDPILLFLLPILERFDSGQEFTGAPGEKPYSASEIAQRLEDLLNNGDRMLGEQNRTWMFAKYAVVSWIDEMLALAHDWSGRNAWIADLLEFRLFRTQPVASKQYFIKAAEATNASADAMESYYVFVMLGFQGLYRSLEINRPQIEDLGFRPDLESWTLNYKETVRAARGLRGVGRQPRIERTIVPATPLCSRWSVVWPWTLTVILAGVNALVFFWPS